MKVHQQLDREDSYSISQKYFEKRIELWTTTVDELF